MTAHATAADLRAWVSRHLDSLETPEPTARGLPTGPDLIGPGWPADPGGGVTRAAVLVPIVERPHGLSVILTRRADALRSHSGQVALPGGRHDPGESPAETALREAEEEIGLDRGFVSLAGLSTPYSSPSGFLIVPVVGFVSPGFTLQANPQEVAEIFETPFGFLMDPTNYEERERILEDGGVRRFYAATHENQMIWGVTAGILRNLYDRLYGAALA